MIYQKAVAFSQGLGLGRPGADKWPVLRLGNGPAVLPTLALLAVAIMMGSLVVFAETQALVACISLLACIFVLMDFRFGVICLILLMPISPSNFFPHQMGGITGLNPMNLVLIGTLGSCLLHLQSVKALASVIPRQLVWFYVTPIVIAALLGSQHLHGIPASLMNSGYLDFTSAGGYLMSMLVKPILLVLFAILVATAVARSDRHDRFVVTMLVSVCAMSLMPIIFVLQSGVNIAGMASSQEREFLSPLGLHANDLGRLYAFAYALMLFTFAETKAYRLKLALLASMALVVVALMLTFSRGAFFGFILVNVWFLATRRKLATLMLAAALFMALVLVLPDAVFERIGFGWNAGSHAANVISAGRVDVLWLPLLPEVWKSPIFGNGLESMLWSDAMRNGTIPVAMDPMQAITHPHNAYLRALLDTGVLGLLLLGAYFLHVWQGFRRLSKAPELSHALRGFYTGAGVGLISFLAAGVVGSSLTPVPEQAFLWLAIGMMYGQQHQLSRVPTS
jgi:hypothetical protein